MPVCNGENLYLIDSPGWNQGSLRGQERPCLPPSRRRRDLATRPRLSSIVAGHSVGPEEPRRVIVSYPSLLPTAFAQVRGPIRVRRTAILIARSAKLGHFEPDHGPSVPRCETLSHGQCRSPPNQWERRRRARRSLYSGRPGLPAGRAFSQRSRPGGQRRPRGFADLEQHMDSRPPGTSNSLSGGTGRCHRPVRAYRSMEKALGRSSTEGLGDGEATGRP
jgi:hypothetical protein